MEYMVERYLPGITPAELAAAMARVRAIAAEMSAQGSSVRYLGSTFVPEEESCFCRFDGDSAEAVREANERARFPFARVIEVQLLTHGSGP